MLCENCGLRRAEIHLVRGINGACVEENICRQCAEKMAPFHDAKCGVKMSFSLGGVMDIGDVLKDLLFPMLPELYDIRVMDLKCPHCGEAITAEGLFGIHNAETQSDTDAKLDFTRIRTPGETLPRNSEGKNSPARVAEPDSGTTQTPCPEEKELALLAKELTAALCEERYERAAEIRDRVAELKKSMIGEGSKEE